MTIANEELSPQSTASIAASSQPDAASHALEGLDSSELLFCMTNLASDPVRFREAIGESAVNCVDMDLPGHPAVVTMDAAGNLVVSHKHVETIQQRFAVRFLVDLFLPFRAISETAGEVPVESDDTDTDTDSDDSTRGVWYDGSEESKGGRGASLPSRAARSKRAAPTDGDRVQTYIFPPSPLLQAAVEGSDERPLSVVNAARLLDVFRRGSTALLTTSFRDLSANTVTLSRKWSRAFSRFEAIIEPLDTPSGGLVIRSARSRSVKYAGTVPNDATLLHTLPGQPSHRLLELHAALALAMCESGADICINRLLDQGVRYEDLSWDGTTHVGLLLQLRMDGWFPSKKRRQQRNKDVGDSEFWIDDAQLVEEEQG